MIVMQMIELWQLYRHMKGIKTFDIHRYVWVLAIVLFFLYLDASYIYLDDSALFKLRIYMYMVIFIGIIGIWMFLDIEAAAWDTETAKHKTELKERDEQLLQVKVKALEEKYQEMLKSRKVVHDMKNHLLALKKYDQERDWEGLHQYLNELSDDMLDDSYQIWTGNRMLDMILNQKTKDAKEKETDMQIEAEAWDVETEQHRAELEEQDKKMLQMKVKAMEEQYREMLKSRKIVHDMKNHLLALKKYTQEQDWKGLEEYLNELSRDMLDYNYQIWTGNHMLDMILNQKEKEAEKQKTQMQISTEVFTTLPFSDREIISLFGNLLDNALEACEQIKEGERWIHIKMKKKNQLLYIEIVNAAKNTGIQTDENFVSKKDGVLHGYGMKNIRDIVEQYNGMFQCKSQEDRFEVVITIYG